MSGDGLGAGTQRDDALEVPGLVLVVGNRPAVAVEVVLARPPARGVPFGDAMHPVRREEAVVDALPEAVFVDRIAEVPVRVAGLVAQGRGRHAELEGRLEVFEDGAPRAGVARAAAVALVHDHQVEEVGGKRPEEPGAPLILGERLVDPEVDLAALDDLARLDLVSRVAERREDAVLGLIDEDVPVGEVEDPGAPMFTGAVPAGTPELPADLEGDRGLARARRHRDEHAAAPAEDGFDDAVDRDRLIVAVSLPDGVVERCEQAGGDRRVAQAAVGPVSLPQFVRGRVVASGLLEAPGVVELDDVVPVGGIGELQPQHLGIVLRLLEAVGGGLVAWFRLDDGEREITRVAQEVVDAPGRFADEPPAGRDDPSVGDRSLLGDGVRLAVPPRGQKARQDELAAGVSFVH